MSNQPGGFVSYVTLSEQDAKNIRWQRINALEIELESLRLLLEETPDNETVRKQIGRITGYLAMHMDKLSEPGPRNSESLPDD